MRTIAMYLPQYHRIKENDEWWGEGFTEWVAVKKSKQLYQNHYQPRSPLNDNYYDLMDKSTMEWQAKLANDYKIDGFSFYHYYFKNGRMVLEKPAENLLKWKDVNLNFFFSWDPLPWVRSWTVLGNSWIDTIAYKKNNDILIEQKYGEEKDWELHFQYLLPFFKDARYMREDGKPIFNILSSHSIPCFDRMISYWRKRIADEGIAGLYIMTTEDFSEAADANVNAMSPRKNIASYKINNSLKLHNYDKVWMDYLNYKCKSSTDNIWQCMVDYDDTPRRGMGADILEGASPEKFRKYYAALRYKSLNTKNRFIFINAWNEWGESMYLEPDKVNEYKYLEAVRDINNKDIDALEKYVKNFDFISEIDVGKKQRLDSEFFFKEKCHRDYVYLRDWLNAKLSDDGIKKYLNNNGYNEVAIYGFGHHGYMIYKELIGDGIIVPYVIDRRATQLKEKGLMAIEPTGDFPKCDLIIISVTTGLSDIYKLMYGKVSCPVITMHELCMRVNEENI